MLRRATRFFLLKAAAEECYSEWKMHVRIRGTDRGCSFCWMSRQSGITLTSPGCTALKVGKGALTARVVLGAGCLLLSSVLLKCKPGISMLWLRWRVPNRPARQKCLAPLPLYVTPSLPFCHMQSTFHVGSYSCPAGWQLAGSCRNCAICSIPAPLTPRISL